jgi:hypothetical protein
MAGQGLECGKIMIFCTAFSTNPDYFKLRQSAVITAGLAKSFPLSAS